MNEITIKDLIELLKIYNKDAIPDVKRAYQLADDLHKGQVRESGEKYITHPLTVAYILAKMHADCDTLCAALLHDTIEDTNIKKEEIAYIFNPQVATLVDGVTKLSKMNFSSKEEMNLYNTRKIISSITEDVRIIIIKLADRLHNMRTLEYKKPHKQVENSLETLELFVPLANYIGAYEIKSELEDLSFKYIKPLEYKMLLEQRNAIIDSSNNTIKEIINKLQESLNKKNISSQIKVSYKNIYQIYKYIEQGHTIEEMHDLISIKILVKDIDSCYLALSTVHQNYHNIASKFKDYIWNPKTNLYQSLHTTIYTPDEKKVQVQIRTEQMDKIASYGLTAYWYFNKGRARYVMQDKLKNDSQFYMRLEEINETFNDNKEFVDKVKEELLSENIYISTPTGEMAELPLGSSIIDYAYKVNPTNADYLVDALVNNKFVNLTYQIKNKDQIKLFFSKYSTGPKEDWINNTKTSYAKNRIKEYKK